MPAANEPGLRPGHARIPARPAGAAAPQAARRPDHGHRPQHGRSRVDGAARRGSARPRGALCWWGAVCIGARPGAFSLRSRESSGPITRLSLTPGTPLMFPKLRLTGQCRSIRSRSPGRTPTDRHRPFADIVTDDELRPPLSAPFVRRTGGVKGGGAAERREETLDAAEHRATIQRRWPNHALP